MLKKNKNNIFHIYLGNIDETYNKKIVLIIDDINNNSTKICFYELYISTKIIHNLNIKPISKINTKFDKVYKDI